LPTSISRPTIKSSAGRLLQESDEGVILRVRVVPGAKQNQVAGVSGNRLRLRIMAPPVEGKANKALVRLLSKILKIRAADVAIVGGGAAGCTLARELSTLLST